MYNTNRKKNTIKLVQKRANNGRGAATAKANYSGPLTPKKNK